RPRPVVRGQPAHRHAPARPDARHRQDAVRLFAAGPGLQGHTRREDHAQPELPPRRRHRCRCRRAPAGHDLHGDGALMVRRARPSGFTLVEVMVALVIMAVLSALAMRGMDALMRAKDAALASTDRTLKLNTGMSQFEYDMAMVVD